ncbi:Uncharacterized protein APZ42_030981 [Daphnia magna]|uniref:Uncharacterized protein n=1 Tax=Daphnia magna TaxID=35525 RepID=A0A164N7U7_9CRUS|nr:Uncharacterized protein APZ42_030981 [Daphnia magna]
MKQSISGVLFAVEFHTMLHRSIPFNLGRFDSPLTSTFHSR